MLQESKRFHGINWNRCSEQSVHEDKVIEVDTFQCIEKQITIKIKKIDNDQD